jgi:ubiquinone/menaquinone biosynthesis C-methylase UbiE
MTLAVEYRKQLNWRDWNKALSLCPVSPGHKVLDLGCGPGDISAELAARGALVTGIDGNDELLDAAKKRLPTHIFEKQDLNNLNLKMNSFDGLWCSFTAAYFTDFDSAISSWVPFLKKDAWICVVEMDDLFGHEPLSDETRSRIHKFYDQSLSSGRYDFRAGRKIQSALEKNGFTVKTIELDDQELSFKGQVRPEVKQAWIDRLNRMNGLKSFLKEDFHSFQEEFINCLSLENHFSICKVFCSVGLMRSF